MENETEEERLTRLCNEATKQWLTMKMIEVQESEPELKELTYLTQKIQGPNGEEYQLSLMHTGGPKFQFEEKKDV